MKTIYRALFVLVCIITLVLPSWAKPVTLKMSTMGMEGTATMDAVHKAEKEIAEKTKGAVKFKFYTGGAMGTGKTLFRKIKFGQLDGGAFTATEASPYCPDMPVLSTMFLFENYDEVDSIAPIIREVS